MRWLVVLFVVPFAFALSLGEQVIGGDHPSLYGDVVAFEDVGKVKVFDLSLREEYVVGSGANPSLFGFGLAYGDAGLIKYVNVRERKIVTVGQGLFPAMYADKIVFSAKENQLGVDVSNDSDRNDDVIQEYDVKKAELKTIEAVGKYPVANQRYIIFVTEELQLDTDLNADGDKNDGVVRVFDRESREVTNTKVEGRDLAISRAGTAAFVSQGKIAFMDARSQKSTVTDIKGEHPSIHDGIILFSRDGQVFGYSTESGVFARIEKGESPSIFGEQAAFVSSSGQGKTIRVMTDEDQDKDDISDFVDNCSKSSGTASDSDKDGVGDSCGGAPKQERSQEKPVVEVLQLNKSSEEPPAEPQATNELEWYWYVLIIAAAVILGPYAWKFAIRYYKKRKKSFGF